MELFEFYAEVPNHAVLKNSKRYFKNPRTGRVVVLPSENAEYMKKWLSAALLRFKLLQKIESIDCDVNARFLFYFPKSKFYTKKGVRSARIADLSNLYEMPQDCLQVAGVLLDDALICSHDGSRRLPIDSEKHYLRITLTKVSR